ncbi:MAG: ComEC/Rec2 family competence protein [Aquiluna sp.]|nr:ComEC/Rec2 family competence protein [Aquiluna sp.]MCF8545191.1 ComEC/Rec2 family competence protein [Aquiluna sp.]
MIIAIAAIYWLLLWWLAPEGTTSNLKQNYPEIQGIESIRSEFLHNLAGVSADSKALVAGLSIGERSLLSDEVASQMKDLSLTHLVAVSGANLAIVMGAIYFLTAAVGLARNFRFCLALCAMAAYVLLVGPESSVLRAATMATFVLIGIWLGRGTNPLISLSWAIILLLSIDPGLAVDFGFSLSATATAGLVLLASKWFEILRTRLPDWLALGIAASASAQLWTTPILLMLQPSLPLYAVIANLLVEPVVAPVTVLGIAAVTLVGILPLASQLLTFLASLGTFWITLVAGYISEWPLTRLHFVQGSNGVVLAAVIVALITGFSLASSTGIKRAFGSLSVLAIVFGFAWSGYDYLRYRNFAGDWSVLNCDVGQGDALLVRSEGRIALIDVGRDPEPIESCLDNLGISHIDLLVLTHFDADHVGGISGVTGTASVDTALRSGFEDDRPLVAKVKDALSTNGAQTLIGFRGLSGELGSFTWKVLAPSFEAKEASDSNDASVTVFMESSEFCLLALADLGEVGQKRLLRSYGGAITLSGRPLITKVAHHGSGDQYRELYEMFPPEMALFSVGKNDYGHPTDRMLRIAASVGAKILRTDELGSIAIGSKDGQLWVSTAGKLSL